MKHRGTVIFAFLVLALWQVATPAGVRACSCAEPLNPRDALAQATTVFSGKVVSVTTEDVSGGPGGRVVTFDVNLAWKGVSQKQMIVHTGTSDADCGFDFQVGQRYIVYASASDGDANLLSTGICDRTKLFTKSAQDVAILGPGKEPVPKPIPTAAPTGQLAGAAGYVVPVLATVGVLMVLLLVVSRRRRA